MQHEAVAVAADLKIEIYHIFADLADDRPHRGLREHLDRTFLDCVGHFSPQVFEGEGGVRAREVHVVSPHPSFVVQRQVDNPNVAEEDNSNV